MGMLLLLLLMMMMMLVISVKVVKSLPLFGFQLTQGSLVLHLDPPFHHQLGVVNGQLDVVIGQLKVVVGQLKVAIGQLKVVIGQLEEVTRVLPLLGGLLVSVGHIWTVAPWWPILLSFSFALKRYCLMILLRKSIRVSSGPNSN